MENDKNEQEELVFNFDKFIIANENDAKNQNAIIKKRTEDSLAMPQKEFDRRYKETWQNRTRHSK